MRRFFYLLALLSVAFCATAAPPWMHPSAAQGAASPAARPFQPAERLTLRGVPNAGRVSDHLLRGAQPQPEGFAELKKLGVAVIVDLRGESPETDNEKHTVELLGMRFVHIPLSSRRRPANAQVAQFLRLLRENPEQTIFVHCHLGADRAGVMIATYRIAGEHRSSAEAYREMRAFHFHRTWLRDVKNYVEHFSETFASDPAFASLRTQTSSRKATP